MYQGDTSPGWWEMLDIILEDMLVLTRKYGTTSMHYSFLFDKENQTNSDLYTHAFDLYLIQTS